MRVDETITIPRRKPNGLKNHTTNLTELLLQCMTQPDPSPPVFAHGLESILNSDLAVVKNNSLGNAAEILKHPNQRIQKTFLILPAVCQHHGSTAVAQPCVEDIDSGFHTVQIDNGFAPVDLQSIPLPEKPAG